jgi:predicted  nucleic acid-binding Zn-ribbon protein
MKQAEIIEELQEKIYTNEKHLQEIANFKTELQELSEKRNQLNKKIQAIKTGIEEVETVLFAPFMELADTQQKIPFE